MNEDEMKAELEAAKERETELMDKVATAEEAKANMSAEIIEERSKKGDVLKELEELKEKQTPDAPETDPEKAVERVLTRMQEKESLANMASSLDEFKQAVPEFSPETDAAGIVFRKFEKELSKFNLSGLSTKEQYQARFKEVYDFMNRESKQATPATNFHSGTPTGGGSDPGADDSATLNDVESRLIKELGWDKARFLEAKAKRPHYVESLLRLRS